MFLERFLLPTEAPAALGYFFGAVSCYTSLFVSLVFYVKLLQIKKTSEPYFLMSRFLES